MKNVIIKTSSLVVLLACLLVSCDRTTRTLSYDKVKYIHAKSLQAAGCSTYELAFTDGTKAEVDFGQYSISEIGDSVRHYMYKGEWYAHIEILKLNPGK